MALHNSDEVQLHTLRILMHSLCQTFSSHSKLNLLLIRVCPTIATEKTVVIASHTYIIAIILRAPPFSIRPTNRTSGLISRWILRVNAPSTCVMDAAVNARPSSTRSPRPYQVFCSLRVKSLCTACILTVAFERQVSRVPVF